MLLLLSSALAADAAAAAVALAAAAAAVAAGSMQRVWSVVLAILLVTPMIASRTLIDIPYDSSVKAPAMTTAALPADGEPCYDMIIKITC
jgi:hypothetical protein